MFLRLRRAAAALLALIMILAAAPSLAFGALEYDEHDVEKLRAFFEIVTNLGYTNGYIVNGSTYDPEDPSTWKKCTWNTQGKLTKLAFENTSATGMLDLEGCEALVTVSCPGCRLTGVDVGNCPKLKTLEVDLNSKITSVNVKGCPQLSVLWVGGNKLSSIDISDNHMLTKLNCNSGTISELDLSTCPQLMYLDCGDNKLTSLDVTCCPLLTELYCKNNLLTELDLTQCVGLYRLRTQGNKLKYLDISVMNGGDEYVIEAKGLGTIGTKCNINSSGTHTLATAKADEGSAFYGWYLNGELVTTSIDYECEFGDLAHLEAKFTMPVHELSVYYRYEDGSEAAPEYYDEVPEGRRFTVPSPVIEGFVPDMEVVEGVMGSEDMTFVVTYSPVIIEKHLLTVSYFFDDGEEAAPTFTLELEVGQEFFVPSPEIEGFLPDIEAVEGVMGEEDINFVVTYSPYMIETHVLTVSYVFADGAEAAPTFTLELEVGQEYRIPSPVIAGFAPDITAVEGIMGEEDIFFTVTYYEYEPHTLMGDVDGNGVVNSNDALYLLRYCLGLVPATEQLLQAGDIDGNGSINSNDALYIMRLSLGLIH